MAVGGRLDGDVVLDDAAIDRLLNSPAGPVGQLLATIGQRVTQEAKRRAPVGDRNSKRGHPAGYLRSQIGWRVAHDTRGLYVDIASPARTSPYNPFPNEPYGLYNERPSRRSHGVPEWVKAKEGPYMVPALRAIIEGL